MAAQILAFAPRPREPVSRDWSRQELAEFYRVESALLQAGLSLEGERGVSDEGDPWFVFCRVDTGEVFIHFAREDGGYVVDGAAFGAPARGRDFAALVRDLIASHPLATTRRSGSNVMLHPAALLIALVGAAFFHSGKAHAAEPRDGAGTAAGDAPAPRRALVFDAGGPAPAADAGAPRTVALDATEVAAVLTGVAIGLRDVQQAAASTPADAVTPSAVFDPMRAEAPRAPVPTGAGTALALAALTPDDARAALTVMAVFHDLAREAAGSSLVAPIVAPAAPATGVELAAPVALATPSTAPVAPATSEPASPVLLVHLAAGATPQIEALAVVAADGALARVSPDHVVHVDQLPSFLADILAHGDVISAAPTGGETGAVGDASAASAAPPPVDSGAALTGAPAAATDHASTAPAADSGQTLGAGAAGALVHPAHGATGTPDAAPAGAAGGGSAGGAGPASPATTLGDPGAGSSSLSIPTAPAAPAPGHDPDIDAAVIAFVTQVADVQVLVSGHDVVFYDPAIMGSLQSGVTLDSVTWRLEDGSTVSLVGTVPELHAAHGVG